MNDNDIITIIKDATNEASDAVILSYFALAKQIVLNRLYPYDDTQTEVPARYLTNQIEITKYLLNKRGAEGEIMHSENGVARSYESADIPASLLRGITPFVGAVR